jgi:signal transduction histidine kinase
LHSSKLEYLGLVTAATSFCKEMSNRHDVKIDFHSSGIPRKLPQEISLCLFRVLQEALQNAMKHSGAQHFKVDLLGESNQINLTVRDPGIGFDPESAISHNGLGLISMKERLKLVEGRLSIESRSHAGTTIHARVPLNPKMNLRTHEIIANADQP